MPPDGLIGAVLCGGRSRRFGDGDKALAPAGEVPLGQLVVNALRGAGIDPVVAVGGTAGPELGLVTVPDRWPDQGPLAGLATILWWARRGDVLVVPCDLPLLTSEVLVQLVGARDRRRGQGGREALVASVDGRPRHSVGIWPAERFGAIRQLIEQGERRFGAALEVVSWRSVEVPEVALSDADTPEQLRELLDRL